MSFKDYFSGHAKVYAQHRPTYPQALFAYLHGLVDQHETVWDCATGNGQVAIGLTPYFQQIYATDASPQQLAHAIAHPHVSYQVAPAEQVPLPDDSVDLITVGLALHWFNFDRFYSEVRRVLRSQGAIAVWCYSDFELPTASPAFCDRLSEFRTLIYPYFPPEIEFIRNRYETLPFPFVEVPTPQFLMTAQWTVNDLMGYLQSLSSTQRFREAQGSARLNQLAQELIAAWQDPEISHLAQWRIYLRAGKLA